MSALLATPSAAMTAGEARQKRAVARMAEILETNMAWLGVGIGFCLWAEGRGEISRLVYFGRRNVWGIDLTRGLDFLACVQPWDIDVIAAFVSWCAIQRERGTASKREGISG